MKSIVSKLTKKERIVMLYALAYVVLNLFGFSFAKENRSGWLCLGGVFSTVVGGVISILYGRVRREASDVLQTQGSWKNRRLKNHSEFAVKESYTLNFYFSCLTLIFLITWLFLFFFPLCDTPKIKDLPPKVAVSLPEDRILNLRLHEIAQELNHGFKELNSLSTKLQHRDSLIVISQIVNPTSRPECDGTHLEKIAPSDTVLQRIAHALELDTNVLMKAARNFMYQQKPCDTVHVDRVITTTMSQMLSTMQQSTGSLELLTKKTNEKDHALWGFVSFVIALIVAVLLLFAVIFWWHKLREKWQRILITGSLGALISGLTLKLVDKVDFKLADTIGVKVERNNQVFDSCCDSSKSNSAVLFQQIGQVNNFKDADTTIADVGQLSLFLDSVVLQCLPNNKDSLVALFIVGGADKRKLLPHSASVYESNETLATARANYIKRLIAEHAEMPTNKIIVMHSGANFVGVKANPLRMASDRSVTVYKLSYLK